MNESAPQDAHPYRLQMRNARCLRGFAQWTARIFRPTTRAVRDCTADCTLQAAPQRRLRSFSTKPRQNATRTRGCAAWRFVRFLASQRPRHGFRCRICACLRAMRADALTSPVCAGGSTHSHKACRCASARHGGTASFRNRGALHRPLHACLSCGAGRRCGVENRTCYS